MDLQDKVGGFTARKVKRMQVVKKKEEAVNGVI